MVAAGPYHLGRGGLILRENQRKKLNEEKEKLLKSRIHYMELKKKVDAVLAREANTEKLMLPDLKAVLGLLKTKKDNWPSTKPLLLKAYHEWENCPAEMFTSLLMRHNELECEDEDEVQTIPIASV